MQKNNLNTKVSVIMNVHNGEKFLHQSVQSVINQSFKNWELVIWDNNSNDGTSLICKSFMDERIKYIKSDVFDSLYSIFYLKIIFFLLFYYFCPIQKNKIF